MKPLNDIEIKLSVAVEKLEQADRIDIIEQVEGAVDSSFRELMPLSRYPAWKDIELDRYMLDAAPRFRGMAVWWETEKPLPAVSGEFRLPGALGLLRQKPDPVIGSMRDRFQRDFVAGLRFIDHSFASSRGIKTCIRLSSESSSFELWHNVLEDIEVPPYPPGYLRLTLTYEEYLEQLSLTKGLHGWQYLFTDLDFFSGPYTGLLDNVRTGLEVFTEHFPDEDYSLLQRQMEERS